MDSGKSHHSRADVTVHQGRDPSRRGLWLRYVRAVAIVLVLSAICIGGVMIYLGTSTSLQAEVNLHATLFTIGLVDRYVDQNGRWPGSWEELEQLRIPGNPPFPLYAFDWPTESHHIKENVTIDFHPDLAVIISQDPMKFTSIRAIGPFYEYRDEGGVVTSLQTTLRKMMEKQGSAAAK
jgi:hypothetical protein